MNILKWICFQICITLGYGLSEDVTGWKLCIIGALNGWMMTMFFYDIFKDGKRTGMKIVPDNESRIEHK